MKNIMLPYAYVLMRNDLASLGSGKAAAHAHHAGTRMTWWIRKHGNASQKHMLQRWEHQSQGVGVTIVLECDEETMKWCVLSAQQTLTKEGCSAGVWRDETYPSTTPRGFMLMPVDVCGWLLGPQQMFAPILGDLPLMSNNSWGRI